MASAASANNGEEDLTLLIDTIIPDYDDPNSTASQTDAIVTILQPHCPEMMKQKEWDHFVRITNEAREALSPNETRTQALLPATIATVLHLTEERLKDEGFNLFGKLAHGVRRPKRNNWAQDPRPAFTKPATPAGYTDKEYENAWKGVREKYYCWSKHPHASSKRLEQGLSNGDVYSDVVKTLKKRFGNRSASANAAAGEDNN